MRTIALGFAGFGIAFGIATTALGEPLDEKDLAGAFELSKACSNECKNESFNMVRLVLPNGKVGFLITTNDQDFCGSGGCSSAVAVVSGGKFVKIKEGLGITKAQAVVLASSEGLPQSAESLECSKQANAQGLHGAERLVIRSQCKANVAAEASASLAPASPSSNSKIIYPIEVSSAYSQETEGRARMLTCRDQYNANKGINANGGLQWIAAGGGYYSACNERLKVTSPAPSPSPATEPASPSVADNQKEAIVQRITTQECAARYQAAQAAGTLAGRKWIEFRSTECSSTSQPTSSARQGQLSSNSSPGASLSYVANTEPPDAYLSLRTDPASSRGQRLMAMPNGTLLEVLKRQPDGWWYVRVVPRGETGWALSSGRDRQWIECCKTASGADTSVASAETPAPSNKPSFNCATAKSASARLICSDAELSNVDAALGKAFHNVVKTLNGDEKKMKIQDQVRWIRDRNMRCQLDNKPAVPVAELQEKKPCLLEAINSRIVELGAPLDPPDSAPTASPSNTNQTLSREEMNALTTKLLTVWRVPATQGVGPEELVVDVRIRLKPDGTLAAPAEVVKPKNSPQFALVAESVINAVTKSQPYSMLKPESYDNWKDIIFTFDQRQTANAAGAVPASGSANAGEKAESPTSDEQSDFIRWTKTMKMGIKCDGFYGDGYDFPPVNGPLMRFSGRVDPSINIREFVNPTKMDHFLIHLYDNVKKTCDDQIQAGKVKGQRLQSMTIALDYDQYVDNAARGGASFGVFTQDGKQFFRIQRSNGATFSEVAALALKFDADQVNARQAQQAVQEQAARILAQRRATAERFASAHPVTTSGPYSSEVLQCARGIFTKSGVSMPMFKEEPCSDYMNLYDVTTVDSREISGGIEVVSQITLQVAQPIVSDSMMAQACYGGTKNNLNPGDKVTVNGRLRFEKWNSGLRCTSTTWQ